MIDFAAERKLSLRAYWGFVAAGTKPILAKLNRRRGSPIIDLSGQLDLLTLAALIKRARLVDGRFRADASGRGPPDPAGGLFGPTNPFHWRPRYRPGRRFR